jgi:L-seryl-tRNA(Ser) seleniumtransferase
LPSAGLALSTSSPDALLGALRTNGEPAVIGRIERGRVILDLRTIDPALDRALAARIAAAVAAA